MKSTLLLTSLISCICFGQTYQQIQIKAPSSLNKGIEKKVSSKTKQNSSISKILNVAPLKAEGCLMEGLGEYPPIAFVPMCVGKPQIISKTSYAGEYSKVQVTQGSEYKFKTSIPTDYITISDENGTQVLTSGSGEITWTATLSGLIRYYIHSDETCSIEEEDRVKYIQCGSFIPAPANDDCDKAITLTCGNTFSGNTLGATSSDNSSGTTPDVFFTYKADGTQKKISISLCGTSFETNISVYKDGCELTDFVIGNNNGSCGEGNEESFYSDGVSNYTIKLEGSNRAENYAGDYKIKLNCNELTCGIQSVANEFGSAGFFTESSGTNQHLAIDIPTGNNPFILYGLKPTIVNEATTFSAKLFANEYGLPGTEIATSTVTIVNKELLDNSIPDINFNRYTLKFDTPFILSNANTTYWLQLDSDAYAWESIVDDKIGYVSVFTNDTTGGSWEYTGGEFVYDLVCEEFLGVNDINKTQFSYYPNPIKDVLNIKTDQKIKTIEIYNLIGQKILETDKISNKQVNLSKLKAGNYIIKVLFEEGKTQNFKIIKQ